MRQSSAEVVVCVCAVDISFLESGEDSSFQNLAEFIGAIVAVVVGIMLGWRGQSVDLRGDSITALTWAVTERARGKIVTYAAMIWATLCVAADINVREGIHLPGIDNDRCNQLSRRGTDCPQSVGDHAKAVGINEATVLQVQRDASVRILWKLCSPKLKVDTDERFATFWNRANTAVTSLLERSPSRPNSYTPPLPYESLVV